MSGNIELDDITSERIDAQVISGNINFSGDLEPNGRYELTSHSGNVRLAIAASAGFQVEATSFSGTITSDIPITIRGGRTDGGPFPAGHRGRRRGYPRSHDVLWLDRHHEAVSFDTPPCRVSRHPRARTRSTPSSTVVDFQ